MSYGIAVCDSSPKKINGFNSWEVEGWVHAIATARVVEKDPKKMKAVRAFAKSKVQEEADELALMKSLAK